LKYQHARRVFRSSVRTNLKSWGQTGKVDFVQVHAQVVKSINERVANLSPSDSELVAQFKDEVEGASNLEELKTAYENFLTSNLLK
jgi:hypothetical protein